MRLVDIEPVLIGIDNNISRLRVLAGNNSIANRGIDLIQSTRDYVAAAPTVDAVPVVRGRWVDRYSGKYANSLYECSGCKEPALYKIQVEILGKKHFVQTLTSICPNCGAKMDLR